MLGNVALDVVIGLVFIYLLYSLFATVLAEIIATQIGLRAYNLKEAVDRMLNDENEEAKSWWFRLLDSLNIRKNPDNIMIRNFYNHPEIKYLGSTGIFKTPSAFKAISFSKTLMYSLSGEGALDKIKIGLQLKKLASLDTTVIDDPLPGENAPVLKDNEIFESQLILDKETAKYVLSLWNDSYGDLVKFKLHLENWFDRTMEQCLEWYKRKIQFILMFLGFFIAWFFNADTFTIIHKLSTNDKARDQIVSMANAYVENNKRPVDFAFSNPTNDSDYKAKLDTLLEVRKQLEQDIADANTILGLGGWPADSILVKVDPSTNKFVYLPQVDEEVLMDMKKADIANGKHVHFKTSGEKFEYFLRLFPLHFFGFLITAIAISLGAPFWFDLLNKLMKLRTAVKQPIRTPQHSGDTDNDGNVSPLNREA